MPAAIKGLSKAVNAVAVCALIAVFSACGGSGSSAPDDPNALNGKITVFAAASLSAAFTDIAVRFEEQHPEIELIFSFAGTPTLRTQLEQGARADVFASANVEQMQIAQERGVVSAEQIIFARSTLVIITPVDNPAQIMFPEDLGRGGLRIILANERVPVGTYTRQVLTSMSGSTAYGRDFSADVLRNVISLESNVKQVAAKVALGEADAGIVYFTDVTPDLAPDLKVISLPDGFNLTVEYPIALVAGARNESGARAFLDFVLSAAGQLVMKSYGFLTVE